MTGWFDSNYLYKKSITIDHTKVTGGVDLSNFPVLVSVTDANLKTIGNGGLVQNSSGFDIVAVNTAESALLNFEVEKYVATTGQLILWVNIPTVSHTVDTVFYLYFGNTTISTFQGNVAATWDSNFVAVWHLSQSSGASNSILDSTTNANNGTPYTTYSSTTGDISTASGQIGTAQLFSTGNAITGPSTTSTNINGTNVYSLSCWYKRTATNSVGTLLLKGVGGVGGYMLGIGEAPAGVNNFKVTKFGVADITGGTAPADTNWHHACVTGNASGMVIYVDGASSATPADTGTLKTSSGAWFIGSQDVATWAGGIDEVRISNVTRTAGWVGTEYNNQSTPSTFYAVGTLTSLSLRDLSTRFKLTGNVTINDDLSSRFRLSVQVVKDLSSRFRIGVGLNLLSRFRLSKGLDLSARFRLSKGLDLLTRFRLAIQTNKDLLSRFLLEKGVDLSSRFRIGKGLDLVARFRLEKGLDLSSRFRLSVQVVKDLSSRFRIGVGLNLLSRFRLSKGLDLSARFRLSKGLDLLTRFRLAIQTNKDLLSRFRIGKGPDLVSRLRIGKGLDLVARFKFVAAQIHDVATRFRLGVGLDLSARFRLVSSSFSVRNLFFRMRLAKGNDLSCRIVVLAEIPTSSAHTTAHFHDGHVKGDFL